MSLTHDILLEVLEHLRYDITADDSEDVIRGQRRGLFNMALLSRSLTSRALDMLWAGMKTLQPMVHVINSSASPEEAAFIKYDINEDIWVMQNQINNDDAVRSRAKEYLGRIQTFYLDKWNLTELSLWRTLRGYIGSNSLLPKLQELELRLTLTPFPPPMDLLPLLSSTITTLTIYHGRFGASNAHILFKLFSSNGRRLKNLTYVGSSSPGLLLDFMHFKDLKSLHISYTDDSLVQRNSTIPVSQVLKHFSSLNTLYIDLRLFPGPEPIHSPPVHHASLETLCLIGDAEDLQDFLLNHLTSPSLHTLLLGISGVHHLSWRLLCKRAASIFPCLRSLDLVNKNFEDAPLLQYRDLLPVLTKQMTALQLGNVVHQLSTADLIAIVKMLPNLHKLQIATTNAPPQEFGASVLVPLSQCPHLHTLYIYLDFSDFYTPLPTFGPPSRSRFTKLYTRDPKGSHVTLEERNVLARNLLTLFPILRTTNAQPQTDIQTMLAEKLCAPVAYCCFFV